jgi:hypothetical protein
MDFVAFGEQQAAKYESSWPGIPVANAFFISNNNP